MDDTTQIKRLSTSAFIKYKSRGEKIVMVTAYDYPTAALLEQAGVDAILVGDSVGMVVQGRESSLPVTLDQMIYHAEMVVRATRRPMVIVDLPFPYCELGPDEAIRAAARIVKETGAGAVKIEGGKKRAATVKAVVEAGIPVMGHCGLMPQNVQQLGGYKIARDIERLKEDVDAIFDAGVFAFTFECVTAEIATEVAARCPVPVIGIGSGNGCDGQVLVFHDLVHFSTKEKEQLPHHVRVYASLQETILDGVRQYAEDVRSGQFPSEKEAFK